MITHQDLRALMMRTTCFPYDPVMLTELRERARIGREQWFAWLGISPRPTRKERFMRTCKGVCGSLLTGIGLGIGFAIGGWLFNAIATLGKLQIITGNLSG